ncbi:MAG: ATP-binding protein [Flavobacteriales bacterium]
MKINLTLRTRIYLSMLAMILVSFLVTGGITIYDHWEQSIDFNKGRILRKEEAVSKSMNYVLNQHGGYSSTDSLPYIFSDQICELSDVHDIFISLYDLRGRYLISSDFMKKDSLNIPDQINYSALKQLSTGNERTLIDSSFRRDNLALVYWYLRDARGKPIAITNVVYEKLEQKNVTTFLRELSQSYILLFGMAALVAYFLSRYITRSLATVGRRMQQVELGRKNEPLIWKSDDEIGSLVKHYNRMIDELGHSADKLAQTERETAWREMAQQVAHEIKNPLTPMKLRVQHIERAWHDNPDEFGKKLHLFTQSMTEQIDTLSRIANEFSNFAKMPKPNLEKLDLLSIAEGCVALYQGNEKYQIVLRHYNLKTTEILADKDQTVRTLNNLITNAIQALPEDRIGKIDIAIRGVKNGILLRVNDNGVGIAQDKRIKIFVPNFTTKSTGTGLGLAMVKNIMIQLEGKVWFWSKPYKGASFYLMWPESSGSHV